MAKDIEQAAMIERLYREMYRRLCIYAFSALRDKRFAEEAVQDTFRIACMKAGELQSSENPQGWLMNTLKYVIQNMKRSQAQLNRLFVSALSIDEGSLPVMDGDQFFSVIYSDIIDSDDFHLLFMVVIEKHTIAEAATALGISLEACKKRVQRAKKRLREALEKNI